MVVSVHIRQAKGRTKKPSKSKGLAEEKLDMRQCNMEMEKITYQKSSRFFCYV
jgi:hypothetical protein